VEEKYFEMAVLDFVFEKHLEFSFVSIDTSSYQVMIFKDTIIRLTFVR